MWDLVGEDRVLKREVKVFSGKMYGRNLRLCNLPTYMLCRFDLAWDGDSKRIFAGGQGLDKSLDLCYSLPEAKLIFIVLGSGKCSPSTGEATKISVGLLR